MNYAEIERRPCKPRYKPPAPEREKQARPQSSLDNLRPFSTMTPEQHKALSSKGGKASVAARARRKEQVEYIKAQKRAESELIHEQIVELKATTRELLRLAMQLQ